MRVLVTGGAGYIGSHTAKVLARSGFEPIVLDNLSTGHRWAVKWGPLIEGDLGDSTLIREVIKTHRVQAVVHFAGFAYVGESMQRPRQYFRNNVTYTLRLLDAMTDSWVKHIVRASRFARSKCRPPSIHMVSRRGWSSASSPGTGRRTACAGQRCVISTPQVLTLTVS